jgi:uncharacterized protein DUF1579
MKRSLRGSWWIASAVVGAGLAGAIALAQESKRAGERKLPPGVSEADMKACEEAAKPGPMHEKLAKSAGTWTGTEQMWMAPGTEPTSTPTTWTIATVMGGRYLKTDVTGDMPGFGPYTGTGLSGFDNVSQQFVADWVDNMSTGIMQGTGELSADGKTLTWKYTFNCPMTKKPDTMREVQKFTSDGTMSVEFFCNDPKSGQEYKCMAAELKKGRQQ